MKLKDLVEKYGEYDVEEWFEIGTDGIADEKGIKIKKPSPKIVWDLEDTDECYYVDTFGDIEDTGGYLSPLSEAIDVGNVFLTREEAEKDVERRRVETLLLKHGGRRWFKKDEWNYYLSFNTDLKVLVTPCTRVDYRQGAIYFDSEKRAKKAIGEIGEDRIRKALFEVR